MIFPSYYDEFHCIAGKCRHNCCVGWEIDIDDNSLRRFLGDGTPFGERFRIGITGDPAHFVLSEDERCPFLNERGLCDIIIEKGEGWLCDICREHPRFYNEWQEFTEAGLGLCCEEAARLILSREKPFTLSEPAPDIRDEYAGELYTLRGRLLDAAFNGTEDDILRISGASLGLKTIGQWAEFYLELERLDGVWTAVLERLRACEKPPRSRVPDMMRRNILAYFIYRHVPEALEDGDAASKAAFAVLSCRMISAAYALGCGDIFELARMYSSEIEYSTDNLEKIYDELWENSRDE